MALNSLYCADVPLSSYSLTHAGVVRWSALVLTGSSLASFGKRNVLFRFYSLHFFLRDPFRTLLTEGSVITCTVGAFRSIAARTAIVSSLFALGADFSSLTWFFCRDQIFWQLKQRSGFVGCGMMWKYVLYKYCYMFISSHFYYL